MSWKDDGTVRGDMKEREFVIDRDGQPVPGIVWSPADGPGDRLLLVGHGATADKRADYVTAMANLATAKGIDVMAIDGPGHGDRPFDDVASGPIWFLEVWKRGGGTDGAVADWQAALDFVQAQAAPRPTAYWGLSMGTMMGLPLTVADDRISLAVLGLMGLWGPSADDLTRLAPQMEKPLRFLVQWDDELVPRDACLALFDSLASKRKTLHANPGPHSGVPYVELVSSSEYVDRYLR